jgi:prepilin-type processing-associated H-X9-DG protein
MGLGLMMYHEDNGVFPPAHVTPHDHFNVPPMPDTRQYFSWKTRILPYIEQDNLYQMIDFDAFPWWQHPVNETILSIFKCPYDSRQFYVASFGGDLVALSGYMGVNGTDQYAFNGILHANAAVRILDITDGTTSTLLVGERPPSDNLHYGWWMAGSGDFPYFGATDIVLGTSEKPDPASTPERFREGTVNDPADEHRWHFWSLHQGGSNFLFADGSVHFISYGAADLMPALATHAGGEVVALP